MNSNQADEGLQIRIGEEEEKGKEGQYGKEECGLLLARHVSRREGSKLG